MKVTALCHTCARRHTIDFDPRVGPGAAFGDWLQKHPGHLVDFRWPRRSPKRGFIDQAPAGWEHYLHNADIKVAYGSSAAYTIGLASLASSATFVAGRESTAVSNTTNLYLDYLVGGKVTTGTTPTAGEVRVYAYGSVDDTPTYPDVLDGTDSAETITSADILNAALTLLADTATDTTSDRAYWFAARSLAAAFGGAVPKNHGLFVAHSTVAALNATSGNHALSYTPIYATAT